MNDQNDQERILEEIFGSVEVDDFTEDAVPQDKEPAEKGSEGSAEEAKPQDNEQVRYQYWQSEADKRANELAKAKAEAEYFKLLATKETAAKEEEQAKFPDPPKAPKQPAGYNLEDAMQDPKSASAQYVAEYQEWQNNMLEYSLAKTEYLEALIYEQTTTTAKEREMSAKEAAAQRDYEAAMSGVEKDVMAKYGVGQDVARDFIQKMSDPQSLTVENLWALYDTVYRKKPKTPSAGFQQAKAAGGFAPAAIVSGGKSTETRSPEDILIAGFKALEEKENW